MVRAFSLDSPAVTDGLPAWQAWAHRLDSLSARDRASPTVAAERKRAGRVILILTQYPNGLDATTPGFRQIVRDLAAS